MSRQFRWKAVLKFFWWFFVVTFVLLALVGIFMWSNDSPHVLISSVAWLVALLGGRDLVRRLSAPER